MGKNQAIKRKEADADPFGPGFAAFAEKSFKKAVGKVWERQRQNGQDSYGTIDGEVVAVKPDGTIEPVVFNPKKNNG